MAANNFENETPHFFKVILPDNLQNPNTLKVPPKFVRKYGMNLSNLIHLKLPTGDVRAVELQRDDHGGLSLQKGWSDFMEICHVSFGYFLVFRYEGDSRFHVVVFDATACEIEYPVRPGIHKRPCPIDGGLVCSLEAETARKEEVQTVESSDDEFFDALSHDEGFDPYADGAREKSPSCCPPIPKKPTDDECPDALTLNQGFDPCENRGREKLPSCSPRLSKKLRTEEQAPNPPRTALDLFKPERGEKSRAFQRASSFPVEGPSAKVVIRCLRRLCLTKSFLTTCFPGMVKFRDIKICLADGKTWTLHISKAGRPRFGRDWHKFSIENNLKAGDVCLFQLIDSVEALFLVIIFREGAASPRLNTQNRKRYSSRKCCKERGKP